MSDSEDEMPPTPLSPHAGGGGGPGFSFGDHRSNADDEDDDEMPPTPLSPTNNSGDTAFSFEGKDVAGENDLADFKEPAAPEMTSTPAPMSPLKARIQARREAEQATLEHSAKQSNDALKEGGARDKSKKVEEEEVAAAAEENEGRGAPVSPVPKPTPTSVPEGDEDEASVPEAADAAAASIGAGTLNSNPAHCGGDHHEAREGGGSGGEASTTEDNTADDENGGANEAFEQVITFVKPEDGMGMAVSLLQL